MLKIRNLLVNAVFNEYTIDFLIDTKYYSIYLDYF